jgi:branched-chain amino acid aminotransferase
MGYNPWTNATTGRERMSDYIAYYNGEWMPYDEVKVHPQDRGFTLGDVVFDVERTFDGKSFRMKEHIDRLYRSLKYARIDPGMDADEMVAITEEAITRNEPMRAPIGDYRVNQWVTRGVGGMGFAEEPPSVCVNILPIDFGRYAGAYETGKSGVITQTRSYSPEALDPKIKHHSRMNFNLATLEANDVDPGAWALLRDGDGNLTEGVGYNYLLVTDGVIRTSTDRAVLQGVSRGMVFDLADQLGIPVVQEDLQPYDLYTADEAFFASTSFCVLPMTRVDKREIGDGRPGPIAQQLLAAWSEAVGLDIVDQATRFAS